MTTYGKRWAGFGMVVAVALLGASQVAEAKGARKPFVPAESRVTNVPVARYGQVTEIVRVRSEDRQYAKFSVEPTRIEGGAVVVFEVTSVARAGVMPRWRCVAVENTSECFPKELRVRYLTDDEKVVMAVRVESSHLADQPAVAFKD